MTIKAAKDSLPLVRLKQWIQPCYVVTMQTIQMKALVRYFLVLLVYYAIQRDSSLSLRIGSFGAPFKRNLSSNIFTRYYVFSIEF